MNDNHNAIVITLSALPPSVNHMYRRGGATIYLDERVSAWRALVWAALREQGVISAPDGALAVTISLVAGDARRRDIDNVIKATLDALAHALNFDDARVARLVVERHGIRRGRPQTTITIAALDEEEKNTCQTI